MNYRFFDSTHPQANGRQAQDGDEGFTLSFDTDEGGNLQIHLGREGFVMIAATILSGLADDPQLAKDVRKSVENVRIISNEQPENEG